MRRTILTLACVFVSCLGIASQQGTLAVRVRDPQRAPVADARITADSPSGQSIATAATARDGSCLLRGLAAGQHLVTVEACGSSRFGPHRVGIEPTPRSISRSISSWAASVKRWSSPPRDSAQTAGEVSKSLTVVDRREMEARGDVARGRRPAVRARPARPAAGAAGSATSVVTRGMRPQDTAVLIDGVRFRDPSGAQGDASDLLGDIVVTDLDRVEILRDPARPSTALMPPPAWSTS